MSSWLARRCRLDRVVALFVGVLTAPLVAVLSWRIRRSDAGPGVIRVTRAGRHGRPLRMLKLRTMRAATSEGHAGGDPLTAGDDARITPLGRSLRARRLDELPQLLHVVRGEMALIGPRPEAPEFVEPGDEQWQRILQAPPAVVGATQLLVADWESRLDGGTGAYRSEVLPVKKAIDAWYVSNATPRIDVMILTAGLRRVAGREEGPLRTLVESAVPEARRIPR